MIDKAIKISMKAEFTVCPTCGYRDGFHSVFKKEDGAIKWLFVCPSCRDVFDLGFTPLQAGQD